MIVSFRKQYKLRKAVKGQFAALCVLFLLSKNHGSAGLLKRQRRKQRKLEGGIQPCPKGRPRKDAAPRDIVTEQTYEIKRLRMENELLRDFLRSVGRK